MTNTTAFKQDPGPDQNRGSVDQKSKEPLLGRMGSLEARLAIGPDELSEAFKLRHRVFQEEMKLNSGGSMAMDTDRWDKICDHLIVKEINPGFDGSSRLVATTRLLRSDVALDNKVTMYSQGEFDVFGLMRNHGDKHFLEIGRTCVAPKWRDRRSVELLWHGIWAYALRHKTDVMIGCASFPGTDVRVLAEQLSYLYYYHAPDKEWEIQPVGPSVEMDLLPVTSVNQRAAFRRLPPLIKGYLRLGAVIGQKAVVDHDFGTVDVFIVLPVGNLNPRHVAYYGKSAERHSA